MTGIDFITQLFIAVDDKLTKANKNHKHPKANLYPSEVVTRERRWQPSLLSRFPIYPKEPACSDYSIAITS